MFSVKVGQHQAREAAGLIVELIRSKRMAGKALLIAGQFIKAQFTAFV